MTPHRDPYNELDGYMPDPPTVWGWIETGLVAAAVLVLVGVLVWAVIGGVG